jgi:hypothetical protein
VLAVAVFDRVSLLVGSTAFFDLGAIYFMPALIWQQIDLAVWLSFFDH